MDKEELAKKLTPKQRRFCHEYIIDWNASRAARAAGYSEKTCGDIGYENTKKPEIKAYIDAIKDNLEEESGVTKLRNLNELAKIAYSSIADLHDTWIERKRFEDLTDEQKAAIESIETRTRKAIDGIDQEPVEIEEVKIKLHSKGPALAELNKMMGYHAAEKLNIGGQDDNPLTIKLGDKEFKI